MHPDVKPLDLSGLSSVLTGLAAWVVTLAVLLFFRDDLRRSGNGWWLWVPVTGIVLGLIGLVYCRRRWAAIQREHAAEAAAAQSSEGSSTS
jgi:ABC-type nickel/cobalt efflux system permease component RcnA